MKFLYAFLVVALFYLPGAVAEELPANKWVGIDVDFDSALKEYLGEKKGRWVTTDGYSDSVYRSKNGSVLIRTGIHCEEMGLSPGYYTNTTVEWDLRKDSARVVEVANWGGGSYGHGSLLPAYKEHKTPSPRHTYDGICYRGDTDTMYMILGANWKIGLKGADEPTRAELKKDAGLTWEYSFEKNRWRAMDDNVWNHFKCSPYENHMTYWPDGGKLLFLNDGGNRYAQFDLETEKWTAMETANECPMRLYNARSTWDSKRSLWVFRLGPKVCTFDPAKNSFQALPDCYDMEIPTKEEIEAMKKRGEKPDPRLSWKGICYEVLEDRYLVCGPTGNDTAAYDPETRKWKAIRGGDVELPNGYLQYDAELGIVALSYQLQCFKFRLD